MTGPISGSLAQYWVGDEATFNTPVEFTASEGVDLIELTMTPTEAYNKRTSHTGTLSLQDEIKEKQAGTWQATCYVAPGAAGSGSDIGEMLLHACGDSDTVISTSVTFSLLDTTPASLQFAKYITDDFAESCNGAWIEEVKLDVSGGEEAKWTFTGGFSSYGCCYQGGETSGSHSATDTVITVDDARLYRPGAPIHFGADADRYLITDIDYSADTITVSPALAGTVNDATAIYPWIASQTLTGSPVAGIENAISIDAVSMGLISASISLKTGIKPLDKEATSNQPTRIHRAGPREVTGNIDVYYLDESAPTIGGAWEGATSAIILRCGPDTASERMTVGLLAARIEVAPVDTPDEDSATASLSFVARQSVAAGDELTFLYD